MPNWKTGHSDEDNNISPPTYKSIIKLVLICIQWLMVLGLIIFLLSLIEKESPEVEQQHYNWNGYDPDRPVYELERLDYETHTIYYSEP